MKRLMFPRGLFGVGAALAMMNSGAAFAQQCVIDTIMYSSGALNPANDCQACLPSQSETSWSPRPEGATCGNPAATPCDNPDACDGLGSCEANHKPDGIVCSDGSACTEDDACDAGVCLGDFIPQPPIVNAAHSRALDVDAGAAGSPIPVALRVTASLDFPCLLQWVAADGSLVGAPVFQLPDDWGTIRVTDPDIVPDAIYEFAAECDGMLSALGSDGTPIWGDLDATGAVDVDDILCVLDGFAGLFFSCSPESVDLDPCEAPNGLIDVSDILRLLDAFSGAAYPCPVPCS